MPDPTGIPANEHDLLQAIAGSDQKAFSIFYGLYKDRIYRTAFSYLRHEEEAEELTQDVFIEIHRSARYFDKRSSVSTWVYRIAINKSLDRIRYRKAKKRFGFLSVLFGAEEDASTGNIPDPTHHGLEADRKESIGILLAAIEKLPSLQKTALILTQLEQLKGKEAAEIMGTTAKAVEGLIQRARANLKKELEKMYPGRGKSRNHTSN